jgi:hypothetical protein
METRTEYAIKLTAVRHGKWQTVIEAVPDHATDREWVAQLVADRREWQANAGRTPDAELVSRVVTVGEWASDEPQNDAEAAPDAATAKLGAGDRVTYRGAPYVITHVFAVGTVAEVIPGDDPDAWVEYRDRKSVSLDELTARPVKHPSAADRYADWEYAREQADYDG